MTWSADGAITAKIISSPGLYLPASPTAIISAVTGVKLHDYGCTLKAYRREVLTGFRLYGEMHRFIPVYANSVGAKIVEVKVHHHERKFGKAKYGLERTFKVILDLFTVKFLTAYSNKPIYLFGGTGMGLITISFFTLLGWRSGALHPQPRFPHFHPHYLPSRS